MDAQISFIFTYDIYSRSHIIQTLLRNFAEVAQEVFNRCITEQKQEKEGSQHSLSDRYDVIMNYEFLDDTYTINAWKNSKQYKRRQDKTQSKLLLCMTVVYSTSLKPKLISETQT